MGTITIKQSNPDFDKKYADQYHAGKESDGNWKDNWSRGYEIKSEIDKIVLSKNDNYNLIGELENGEKIDVILPNMTILKCLLNDKTISEVAISTELIKKTLRPPFDEKYNLARFYFYLKPRDDYYKFGELIFVLEKDIPKKLIKNTTPNNVRN